MNSREMLAALDAYAAEPADLYWIHDDDSGNDYCHDCARFAAIAHYAVPDLVVALGWDSVSVYIESEKDVYCIFGIGCGDESDSCRHCATCGALLDYTLTDFGGNEELAHYFRRRLAVPLNKEEAFHIARVLACKESDPAAIRLARRACSKIPQGA